MHIAGKVFLKKIKRSGIVLLTTTLLLLLTGCDILDYEELDTFSIIMGTAIDGSTVSGYQVINEIAEIKKQGGSPSVTSTLLESKGFSIYSATRNGVASTGKHPYFGYSKVIIISRDVAEEGIVPVLDFSLRNSESQISTLYLVSGVDTAAEIFNSKAFNSPIISEEIERILKARQQLSQCPSVALDQLVNLFYQKGNAMVLPMVNLHKSGEDTIIDVSGCAIFRDDKMVGTLNDFETKMYMFATGQVKGGTLDDRDLGYPDDKNIALDILKCNYKVRPVIDNGVLKMKIENKITVSLAETGNQNTDRIETMRQEIPAVGNQNLSVNIWNLIRQIQHEYGPDIFQFADVIRRDMPQKWKEIEYDWDRVFRELPVEVSTEIKLQDSKMSHGNIRSVLGL